jgi:tape measure domain-containing protein
MEEGDFCMSSVDNRIVNMQFNNTQFQTGAADSMKSLQTLEQTIGGMGSSSSGLTAMGGQVDAVSTKFGALQVAAVTALATIVNKAVNAGLTLLKSMTLDPLLQGFQEYETNLNSIQTIMANTGKSVQVVNSYLKELNEYSDLTIYSFSQMAENIGRFTAAGVELRDATDAIKGLANTAALSGSNVQQLNTAMYQMSQALSTGTIRLMDWNSLANAGMGGENIREALMATTETLKDNGAAMKEAIDTAGSFRDSLQYGWLTAETFTKTMKVMAGTTLKAKDMVDLTNKELVELGWKGREAGDTVAYTVEQLKKMGYSKEAAEELNRLSQAAIDSATKVKTFTQLIDVVKESIGSGWARVFQNLFGNFDQATKMWTGVKDTITDVVDSIFDSINGMLKQWRSLGGYEDLWTGIGNIFQILGNLIGPFVDAFQSLFPASETAGSGLAKVTGAFADFTEMLVGVTEKLDVITPVLSAVFSAFRFLIGIVVQAVKTLGPVIDLIGDLASKMGDLAAQGIAMGKSLVDGMLEGMGITDIRSSIENFANSIVDWIKSALGIASPAAELVPVGEAIVLGIAEGIANAVGVIGEALVIVLDAIMELLPVIYMKLLKIPTLFIMALADALPAVRVAMASIIATLLGTIGDAIPEIASLINTLLDSVFNILLTNIPKLVNVLTVLTVEVLGYLAASIPLFIETGLKILLAIAAGIAAGLPTLAKYAGQIIATLADAFIGAIGTLVQTISNELNLGLGDSFGQLDWARIFNALIAGGFVVALLRIATAFKGFVSTVAGPFEALTGTLGAMQNQLKAQSLLLIATAVGILVAALVALEVLDAKSLAKNLGIMGGMMASLSATIGVLGKMNITGVTAIGGAMLAIAGGVFILVTALKILESISLRDLAEGVGAIGISMGIFVASLKSLSALGAGLPQAAAGIAIMAGGMILMAMALKIMAKLELNDIIGSLVTMAIGLSIMVGALSSISALSGPLIAGSVGIFIIAGAMLVLAQALKAFGALNLGDITQGLATMGIALAIMTSSLFVLGAVGPAAMAGAAAIFIVAAAMLVLAKAFAAIGQLPLDQIGTSLVVMAVALGIVLAAAFAAQYVALGLIVLSGAMLALGLAVALLGAGLLAGATAFAIFATIGAAGIAVVIAGLTALMALLPAFASQLALAIVSFIQTIAEMAPRLREAFGTIIKNILGTIRDAMPQIQKTMNAFLGMILNVIRTNIPKIGKVWMALIETGLRILRQGIPLYVRTGVAIIEGVLRGIADRLPGIIDAGTDLIIAFIEGIGQAGERIVRAALVSL